MWVIGMSVHNDPLITELKDVTEQGVFNRLQLAEQAIVPHLLLALEDQIKRIDLVDLLQ